MKVKLMKYDEENIVAKAARLCYFSSTIDELEEEMNDEKCARLIKKLKSLNHQSPFEHVSYTFGIEGVSRACMAQITRHRLSSYCLSGNTKILRYNNRGCLTLKELYDRQNVAQLFGRNKLLRLRSMNENNIIVKNKLINVIQSGIKKTYTIKTSLGYEIRSTLNHIFFNDKGEVQLKNLNVGDKVYVNGIVVKKVVLDKIIAIEEYGNEMTYDLEMNKPYHNFIANGFVVHNSIKSQRYVKEAGFEYVIPKTITENNLDETFISYMEEIQRMYNRLIELGIKKEDSRMVLPNACETKIIMTINARSLQNFFNLRRKKDAQWEIRNLANEMYSMVKEIHPNIWSDEK